jgi:hypothetical protein
MLLPIKLCFRLNLEFTPYGSLEIVASFIPVLVFFLDMLVNFNTVFYEEGELVDNRIKIIKNYLFF